MIHKSFVKVVSYFLNKIHRTEKRLAFLMNAKDIKNEEALTGFIDNEKVIVFNDSGKFIAHSAVCTHMQCTVDWNRAHDEAIHCHCHGARFDPRSGEVLRGPAKLPLPPLQIEIDPSGDVHLKKT